METGRGGEGYGREVDDKEKENQLPQRRASGE
jgi:hypothetical protein